MQEQVYLLRTSSIIWVDFIIIHQILLLKSDLQQGNGMILVEI
jgi:hypothetical protein